MAITVTNSRKSTTPRTFNNTRKYTDAELSEHLFKARERIARELKAIERKELKSWAEAQTRKYL